MSASSVAEPSSGGQRGSLGVVGLCRVPEAHLYTKEKSRAMERAANLPGYTECLGPGFELSASMADH